MAGSGWGAESDARGSWYAKQDFSFRNLQVQKGEKLPSAWQVPQNVSYLKQTYGENCVEYRSGKIATKKSKKAEEETWVPVHKESVVQGKRKAVA